VPGPPAASWGDTIVTWLDASIEQLLITVDGAGSSYALVDHITVRRNSATVRTSQKSPGLLRTDPAGDQLEEPRVLPARVGKVRRHDAVGDGQQLVFWEAGRC